MLKKTKNLELGWGNGINYNNTYMCVVTSKHRTFVTLIYPGPPPTVYS